MSKAGTVCVTLLNVEQGELDWPPGQPAAFMAWWQDKIAQIPEEYRTQSCIKISSESGYGVEHAALLEISYSRPENEEEREARLREEQVQIKARMERHRAQYEALRKKYEEIS